MNMIQNLKKSIGRTYLSGPVQSEEGPMADLPMGRDLRGSVAKVITNGEHCSDSAIMFLAAHGAA